MPAESEKQTRSEQEDNRIISESQIKLLRTDSIEELFSILSSSVHELTKDGIVASMKLNSINNSMQFVSCFGLGNLLEKIVNMLGFDPTKESTPIDKMSEKEFRKYRSGKLEKIPDGIHGLLENFVPAAVSSALSKMMGIKEVFTIGLIQKDLPVGGLVILTRRDISEHFDTIERLVGQAAFIVQRKLAEEALKESEERFKALHNASFGGIAIHDRGVIFDCNLGLTKITGYSIEELIGMDGLTLIAPDFRKTVMNNIMTGFEKPYEVKGLRKNGEEFHLRLEGRNIPYKGKKMRTVEFRDITEQKNAEKEVLKIVQHYKALIEKAPDGVVLIDSSGSFKFISSSARKIFGYGAFEEINGSPDEFTHPDDLPMVLSELEKLMINPSYVPILQYRFAHKTGDWIWIESTFSNLLSDPSVEAIVINFRDITDRKKVEEIIQRSDRLESLGILAGGIAHDFNNLLAGIFGYMDLAISRTTEHQVSEYLKKSLSTIERARGLTQQLLTFSKGGTPVRKVDNLFPFLKETALFALSGSNVSVDFDYPENLWTCNFDRNQIGQVIDNLVINAQQAMPVGGTIEFSAQNISLFEKEHPALKHGNYVKISIRDSGIGIPDELLSRIFDPFFTTKPKGHGLGLSTCYSIINRHDGCIDVESWVGKGTAFHVFLPASSENISGSTENSVLTHKGSGTFLVVDDEEVLCEIISEMLKSFGYEVVVKTNGKDAVEYFNGAVKNKQKITGMIFDLTIPGGMGGVDTLKEIRKIDSLIPVFVASGYTKDAVMSNPQEYGFTASICKPFKIEDLEKMLSSNLKY